MSSAGEAGERPSRAQLDRAVAEAQALQARGRLQQAHDLLRRVLAADSRHAGANHALGLLLHQGAGRHDEAAELIARAVAAEPRNAIYRSNLGVVLKEAGRLEEAVASYEAALQHDPRLAQTRSNLGVALLALGRVDEAIAAQRQALAVDAGLPEAHANLGLALIEKGEIVEALSALRSALALRPDYANAQLYLARALLASGEVRAAEEAARRALELRPQNPAAHHILGNVLAARGRLAEAAQAFRAALAIAPDPAALAVLGRVLARLGEHKDAIIAFRSALALNENDAETHVALAAALMETGGTVRALDSARRAVALDPGNRAYRSSLAGALLSSGLLDEAMAEYERLLQVSPEALDALGAMVFASNYQADLPADETTRRATELGRVMTQAYPARTQFANDRDPGRRLKLGLVSADFNLHPVAYFLENVLRTIDAENIELFAYSLSSKHDAMTARLKPVFAGWCEAAELAPAEFDARILADGIDILIDLTGHTHGGIPPVFALKSAPVTASWLGYSGTTGLPTMDYILADAIVAPPGEAQLFTEKIVRLPDSYLCYTPEPAAPEVSDLPALANGHITFGSFNNLNKVSDRTVALWARLLQAVPGSRLAFKGAALRRAEAAGELEARFAIHGIGPERLKLLPYEPETAGHLSAYAQVDIGLDPFPYNGTTTTCEAMLMGVPVLTLRGDRFIAHVGESLLHSVGLDGWVAADEADYLAKAAAFAADLPALAALRARLRGQLLASPLCDAPRFARHFEAALRDMWRAWCEG